MKDLLKLDTKKISELLIEKREALREFRFGVSGSKLKNVKLARTIKKDIARIMTVLNMKKVS